MTTADPCKKFACKLQQCLKGLYRERNFTLGCKFFYF